MVIGTKQFNDKTTHRQQVKRGFVQKWENRSPGLFQDFFIFQGLNIFPILYNTTFKSGLFQRQLSIINFTLNYPPIRKNLTCASLLSILIETDYLNYPPIRNNLTSASLLSILIETDYDFKKIPPVFFGFCLKEFHSVWNCLLIEQNAKLF